MMRIREEVEKVATIMKNTMIMWVVRRVKTTKPLAGRSLKMRMGKLE